MLAIIKALYMQEPTGQETKDETQDANHFLSSTFHK